MYVVDEAADGLPRRILVVELSAEWIMAATWAQRRRTMYYTAWWTFLQAAWSGKGGFTRRLGSREDSQNDRVLDCTGEVCEQWLAERSDAGGNGTLWRLTSAQ